MNLLNDFSKMTKMKNDYNEIFSSNLVFLRENHFWEDWRDISIWELTLNFENALFLSACHYFNLQDIKFSFEDVDFYAKLSLILDTPVGNSTTQWTILDTLTEIF